MNATYKFMYSLRASSCEFHTMKLCLFNRCHSSSVEDSYNNDSPVIVDHHSGFKITTIGINRPRVRNCVNAITADALRVAFENFETNEDAKCAVLHGIGGNFCAGYDLSELAAQSDTHKLIPSVMDHGPMGPTRMVTSKPIIAAVTGYAVAGGLELAIFCDLRVVEENAKMGVLCRRLGVPLMDGGTIRLPALIGLSRALDLILTGRLIEAKEAYEMGLANRIVKTGTAFGQAMSLAKEIAKFPQDCLRTDRKSSMCGMFDFGRTFTESLLKERDNAIPILMKESIDGARRFMGGLGRHGKFNVTPVAELEEWQKEFLQIQRKRQLKKEFESTVD